MATPRSFSLIACLCFVVASAVPFRPRTSHQVHRHQTTMAPSQTTEATEEEDTTMAPIQTTEATEEDGSVELATAVDVVNEMINNSISEKIEGEVNFSINSSTPAEMADARGKLLSDECTERNEPKVPSRFCSSLVYVEKDIRAANTRPIKCLQDMLPGVRARMCTLCTGHACNNRKKVVKELEKHLKTKERAERVISMLQLAHTVQGELMANFTSWDLAFEHFRSKNHRELCQALIQEGRFGPGLCRKELNLILPSHADILMNVCDMNRNELITSGELRTFFDVASVFSTMAGPVVQAGKTYKAMREFKTEATQKWLKWEENDL